MFMCPFRTSRCEVKDTGEDKYSPQRVLVKTFSTALTCSPLSSRRAALKAKARKSGVLVFTLYMARRKRETRRWFKGLTAIPTGTKRGIGATLLFLLGILLLLAAIGAAGVVGEDLYRMFSSLLGVGYFLLPLLAMTLGTLILRDGEHSLPLIKGLASLLFFVTGLALVDIATGKGGLLGGFVSAPVLGLFDLGGGILLLGSLALVSVLLLFETTISPEVFGFFTERMRRTKKEKKSELTATESAAIREAAEEFEDDEEEETEEDEEEIPEEPEATEEEERPERRTALIAIHLEEYTPPPLSLLERDKGKPGVGDIKANANIIKRTLQNFGIIVELDEISIGPAVTRYAIKPAEGVRLSKIVALQQNLELALAAKGGVRIEAPIPGKSLVGIEVPNTAKMTVGLGSLLSTSDFQDSGKPLLVALGKDIGGMSHFANVSKMPHFLIAGATGSGKSVTIHTLITSLLYRNGPQNLRFLMIDPKRVELTLYNKIPHLLSPVITDAKKAIIALKWAAKEMDRRYDILEAESVRDIQSYHENVLGPALEKLKKGGEADAPQAMPYIVIIIDELADIMQTYPRELEAAVVRLAQMSRAVGIHLILSTQRPSVNVITGLIKANIPARIALQVASQVDSRTILDGSGAEKLLGAGDMLYISGEMGKPLRLQSAFIGESEVKKVVSFIASHNEAELPALDLGGGTSSPSESSAVPSFESEDVDDDMYEEAKRIVIEAGKASTSYMQRKLRIGYARAARLMDMLEERGVIGPADGARPRDVLVGRESRRDEGAELAQEDL